MQTIMEKHIGQQVISDSTIKRVDHMAISSWIWQRQNATE